MLPLKAFVPHSINFTQHPRLTTNGQTFYQQLGIHLDLDSHIHLNFTPSFFDFFCLMLMIAMYTYFWSSDPLFHPYSHVLTLTCCSHVTFSASYCSSCYTIITLHLISFLPLSYKYHDYNPSTLSPHVTQYIITIHLHSFLSSSTII